MWHYGVNKMNIFYKYNSRHRLIGTFFSLKEAKVGIRKYHTIYKFKVLDQYSPLWKKTDTKIFNYHLLVKGYWYEGKQIIPMTYINAK